MKPLTLALTLASLLCGPAAASDKRVSGQQVMIEVKVVEVSHNEVRELGFDWTGNDPSFVPSGTPALAKLPVAGQLFRGETGKVRSAPRIMTLSGKEALIFVGGDLRLLGRTYPNFGLELKIVPIVDLDAIRLQILIDVDQVDLSAQPSITSRTASSHVSLPTGQSLAIAGLYTDRTRLATRGIPELADVPVLGWLFRNRAFADDQLDLTLLVTPRLVGEASSKGRRPATPGEDTRRNPNVHRPTVDPNLNPPNAPQYPQQPQTPQYPSPKSPNYPIR